MNKIDLTRYVACLDTQRVDRLARGGRNDSGKMEDMPFGFSLDNQLNDRKPHNAGHDTQAGLALLLRMAVLCGSVDTDIKEYYSPTETKRIPFDEITDPLELFSDKSLFALTSLKASQGLRPSSSTL